MRSMVDSYLGQLPHTLKEDVPTHKPVDQSRWCSKCQRWAHKLCTGKRAVPHCGRQPCECTVCAENKQEGK